MAVFSTLEKAAGVWGGFAAKLLRRYGYPKAIQQRGIDMRSGLHEGVGGNLRIVRRVQDRLHVIQNGVDGCDQVQKAKIRVKPGVVPFWIVFGEFGAKPGE